MQRVRVRQRQQPIRRARRYAHALEAETPKEPHVVYSGTNRLTGERSIAILRHILHCFPS